MSTRELTRAGVLARVGAGTLSLKSAAAVMAVSYRQAKRLYRRYRNEGARGLKHRSAGRRSNAAREGTERERILALIRDKYSGPIDERFGPTLAAEHLASEDGLHVHHERCGAGCSPPACGTDGGTVRPTGSAASGKRILGSWCSWMGASMRGSKRAGRGRAQ
jgi:transposase